MLFDIVKVFAAVFYFSWFVWPFAFVFGLAYGIRELIETKKPLSRWLLLASVALLLIVCGVIGMNLQ